MWSLRTIEPYLSSLSLLSLSLSPLSCLIFVGGLVTLIIVLPWQMGPPEVQFWLPALWSRQRARENDDDVFGERRSQKKYDDNKGVFLQRNERVIGIRTRTRVKFRALTVWCGYAILLTLRRLSIPLCLLHPPSAIPPSFYCCLFLLLTPSAITTLSSVARLSFLLSIDRYKPASYSVRPCIYK